MKGNEARVVFFLHPVDQLKHGKVSRVQPLRSSLRVTFLFFLGLLGLGVLVYVLLQFGVQIRGQQELVSATEVSFVTTTESSNTSAMRLFGSKFQKMPEMEHSKGGNAPYQPFHLEEVISSNSWLPYPLVASSSLLLAYLAALIMKWGYTRFKLVQEWVRILTGKLPQEEKMLLHTLPYYLAITRSSCEVS